MAAIKQLNANAETMGDKASLFMNINAAKGLHDVMKTNLGPKGTIKMLVSGAGGDDAFLLSRPPTDSGAAPLSLLVPYRDQVDQGWERAAEGNADPESHSRHDRQDCRGAG